MKKLHLVCNAHLDPVWQWEWEEGAAAAISTFRQAARFCEEFDAFVFNHNEAILYEWIEEYEPSLFKQIQELVKAGKWHILGGWYLQPDCNMPSGESFVRQMLAGRQYFAEKFGAAPKTAVSFDAFGHSRGLVQIMRKMGFDSYIFMRPGSDELDLPSENFIWKGFDESEITVLRLLSGYNTPMGHAADSVTSFLEHHKEKPMALCPWGVGNHGGGPSRIDIQALDALIAERGDVEIVHSTPEAYFAELAASGVVLPVIESDLNPNQVGCYTSQVRIKQKHRLLENEMYMCEKMLSSAAAQGKLVYPEKELREALRDLLTSEFHDILPGSSVKTVEETSLRMIDHGLEILARLKARAFFALSAGQKAAGDDEIPVMVYNPHPYRVDAVVECEFMLPDQNWKEEFTLPVVYRDGVRLPSQPEKENSNINLDWRKRIVFRAALEPSQMNRFDVRLEILPQKPKPVLQMTDDKITFKTDDLHVVINGKTGLMDTYRVQGKDYLQAGAFRPLITEDFDDSWGLMQYNYREVHEPFRLMTPEEGAAFSGIKGEVIPSVRVIEDGDVRTVVEVLLCAGQSAICQRYKLPKQGTEVEVELFVHWNEKTKMLKLSVPSAFDASDYIGQTAFGVQELLINGDETVSQKWSALVSDAADGMLTFVGDGGYGSDCVDSEVRFSLLRSPGYTCIDMTKWGMDRVPMPKDRFSPRIDQGERHYRFRMTGGGVQERKAHIDREALAHNEVPFALSFSPPGEGEMPKPMVTLGDDAVQMTACKKAVGQEAFIIRLFEPTGTPRSTTLAIPFLEIETEVTLGAFEVKTLLVDCASRRIEETAMSRY